MSIETFDLFLAFIEEPTRETCARYRAAFGADVARFGEGAALANLITLDTGLTETRRRQQYTDTHASSNRK